MQPALQTSHALQVIAVQPDLEASRTVKPALQTRLRRNWPPRKQHGGRRKSRLASPPAAVRPA
jgi:hypothetical protein